MPCNSKKSSKAKAKCIEGHSSFTKIIEDPNTDPNTDEGSEWEIDLDDEDLEDAKKSL
jgi:hypothetical protein